ncbi:MAG: dipeptide epimerase, partial [Anaerolineae bacterium]|nr:dipeptide epimerase [Anaerolineae bacterium]
IEGWRKISSALPKDRPPLIADESVQGVESISALAGLADGINIKLAKCGGLFAARQMIRQARELGMKIMLGCMVESSVAVTAMSHLAPLADYLDLDGNQLLKNDPYRGLLVDEQGNLTLPDAPRLGVYPHVK